MTAGLYTTSDPRRAWSLATAAPPTPDQASYALTLAVAPHSPGDGASDVLFFGATSVFRSTDAGRTWAVVPDLFHADIHTVAFAPPRPAGGAVAATLLGCDGGLARSSNLADAATIVTTDAAHYNEGATLEDTATWQSLNGSRACNAIIRYGADPDLGALGWIACQDTGLAAGTASTGWRGLADADVYQVAVAPVEDGIAVWFNGGAYFRWWPSQRVISAQDRGGFGLVDEQHPTSVVERRCDRCPTSSPRVDRPVSSASSSADRRRRLRPR